MTKFLFDERFPTKINVTAPLTITKYGTTYNIGISTGGILEGDVWTWQLRRALETTSATAFHTYEASLGADLSDSRRNRWEGGGRTSQGDGLSNDIKSTLAWSDGQMTTLYTVANTITG